MSNKHSQQKSLLDLSGLYDFSLDIERHEDDAYFVENGGQIQYVFDENIFEMFVFPKNNWTHVERSPSVFTGKRLVGRRRLRQIQDMQTALATAEILFGGNLPGQKGGKIFLTEWHRWELLARTNEILGNYSGSNIGAFRQAAKSLLPKKLDYWKNEMSLDKLKFDPKGDPQVSSDIEELNLEETLDFSTLQSFIRNRDVAYLLADDDNVEPAQQLSRILAPDMQKRMRGIVSIARPSEKDSKDIQKAARNWSRSLKNEYDAQLKRNPTRRPRSGANLWNDARSLALIEWISDKKDSGGRRLVFVTGDATLFDAYRRIYEEGGRRGRRKQRGSAPFLLRRPLQYSPFFLGKIDSTIVKEKAELIKTVRQSVELALVPIRLAAISQKDISEDFLKRRHSITLRPNDSNSYFDKSELESFWDLNKSYFKEQRIAFTDEELAKTERIFIGLSRDLLELRLTEEEKDLFSEVASWGDEQERKFGEHIENSIKGLLNNAIDVWQPIASKFFKKTLESRGFEKKRKVPIAIKLAVKIDDAHIDFLTLLEMITKSTSKSTPLLYDSKINFKAFSSPFEVFLASSVLALQSNLWRMADHFCEMAINSVEWPNMNSKSSKGLACEAYYLSALSKRYRLGDMVAVQRFGSFLAAQNLYDEANEALDLYEKSIIRHISGDTGMRARYFARLRCHSERAALNLFFASLSKAFAEELSNVEGVEAIQISAKKAHKKASASFDTLIRNPVMRDALRDPKSLSEGSAIQQVILQIVINACAWFCLGEALKDFGTRSHNPNLARFCIRNMKFLEAQTYHDGNPVVSLEIDLFKILQMDAQKILKEKAEEVSKIKAASLDLKIDQYLLKQLKNVWLELSN